MMTSKESLLLSALAYVNFDSEDIGKTLSEICSKPYIKEQLSDLGYYTSEWQALISELSYFKLVGYENTNPGWGTMPPSVKTNFFES